jgi:hypothetical protein
MPHSSEKQPQHYIEAYQKSVWPEILHDLDARQVRAALETAHRIREFEISLYWTRSAYVWAIQAALIAIAAYSVSSGNTHVIVPPISRVTSPDETTIVISNSSTFSSLFFLLMISTLGLAISTLWTFLLKGAKFWQNNWERHVDLLEKQLKCNLYKTYPVLEMEYSSPPISVTKVNRFIAIAFVTFWFLLVTSTLFRLGMLADETNWQITGVVLAFIAYFSVMAFYIYHFCHPWGCRCLHMSNWPDNPIETSSGDHASTPVFFRQPVKQKEML